MVINGNGSDNFINGTAGGDIINGLGGNDFLAGLGGADTLHGGVGDDVLTAEGALVPPANDELFGEDGNDTLIGGNGSDSLDGGNGNDTLSGFLGDDFLFGNIGFDSLDGGEGNDTLDGGTENDTLAGSNGNDIVDGFNGDDSLSGGAGNDILFGGTFDAGDDTLAGDDGNDSLDGGDGDDSLDGGNGNDTLDGGNGSDTLIGGEGNDRLSAYIGFDTQSGSGSDSLVGGAGSDTLTGARGNDTIDGGIGNDTVFAGDGDDLVFGGDGNENLDGSFGNDTIDGGNGDDVITGFFGDDSIHGGPGNDFLSDAEGNDTLTGGPGADVFVAHNGKRITDASLGDLLRHPMFMGTFSGQVTAGNGESLSLGEVQASIGPQSTTLFLKVFEMPSIVNTLFLEGTFLLNNFQIEGNVIRIVSPPALSIADASVIEGDGGQQNLVFTVSIPAATTIDVTATVTTSDGTATAGPDYNATVAQVTIPAGQVSVTASVVVSGDLDDEPDETLTATLSNPIAAVIGDGVALGTILDDDAAPPTVSIAGASIGEGDAGSINLVFSVTLSGATAQDVVVTATTANGTASAGSDYTATSTQVTIPAGQTGASVVVPILGDTVDEPDETFTVTLSGPVNATLGAQIVAAGGILDDDGAAGPPVLSIADASLVEGDSGLANLVFTISLSAPAAQIVTASAATSNRTAGAGNDYGATNVAILIPVGQLSTTLSVPILGDNLAEASETFAVTLSNIAGDVVFPGNAATTSATGTILDDDSATVAIGAASVGEGNGGSANLVFPLTLTSALGNAVVVSFRTVDGMARPGSDYTDVAGGSVTIPAGLTTGSIAIAVSGDAALECSETLAVELTSVTGGASIAPAASFAFGTIANDDGGTAPSVTGTSSSGTEAGEGLAGGAGNDSLSGLGGNDTLSGVAGADILAGGSGNDLAFGDLPGSGNDSILGGDGADTGVGGDGADTMLGGAGDDFLIGEGGADTLMGGLNNDVLFGLDGADYQCGEEGNDFLFGGGGDLMDAGADNDRVHVNAGDVFATGSEGFFDVLVLLDNAPIANTPNQGVTAIDLNATLNQNLSADGPRLQGFEAVDASIASAGVSVTGAAGTVDFGQGPVTVGAVLFGSTFADTLTGSSAADILLGNLGADALAGGAGNDTLIADAGNDTLTGGDGADELFYTGAAGAAVIVTDFAPGEDLMDLAASLGIADGLQARLLLQQGGDDVVLPLGSGRSVIFLDHLVADFSAGSFQIV